MARNPIKEGIYDGLSWLIPFGWLRRTLPRQFIVCGHLIGKRDHPVADYYRYPTEQEFDSFVARFKTLGYEFTDLPGYLKDDNKRKILLTLDDGFKAIIETVHPYLRKNGIPYVVFILSDPLLDSAFYISSVKPKRESGSPMFLSYSDVLTLRSDGVHVGFHTTSHKKVHSNDINDEEAISQLKIPTAFASLLSRPLCFAYPYYAPANHDQFNRLMQERFGYELFFDTKGFLGAINSHLFRVSIDGERTLETDDWMLFVIKKQLVVSLIRRIRQSLFGLRKQPD